eukprot:g3490.t1 g3490   contig12:2175084-2176281(+)
MVPRISATLAALLLATASSTFAFTTPLQRVSNTKVSSLSAHNNLNNEANSSNIDNAATNRRAFLSTTAATATASSLLLLTNAPPPANADEDSFESIAARAARVSQEVSEAEKSAAIAQEAADERRKELAKQIKDDPRTIYDFKLPIGGVEKSVGELVGQEFESENGLGEKVKAILVVNIKQDDPIARKNIPELIALASKFGKNGEFAVITKSTYSGVEPLPFWRWIEGSCRTPAGLGKIQANFEKFLVDGRTGKAIRRYPRKYQPYDIADDIAAVVQGRPLPPAQMNFKEEWRTAAKEAEADTYRFQKGLNYFDQ